MYLKRWTEKIRLKQWDANQKRNKCPRRSKKHLNSKNVIQIALSPHSISIQTKNAISRLRKPPPSPPGPIPPHCKCCPPFAKSAKIWVTLKKIKIFAPTCMMLSSDTEHTTHGSLGFHEKSLIFAVWPPWMNSSSEFWVKTSKTQTKIKID